jgi:molecular chaperone DnaK (HSP70)
VIGLDFGTTNSAIAVAARHGVEAGAALATFPDGASHGDVPLVLYVDPSAGRERCRRACPPACRPRLPGTGQRRLIQ